MTRTTDETVDHTPFEALVKLLEGDNDFDPERWEPDRATGTGNVAYAKKLKVAGELAGSVRIDHAPNLWVITIFNQFGDTLASRSYTLPEDFDTYAQHLLWQARDQAAVEEIEQLISAGRKVDA